LQSLIETATRITEICLFLDVNYCQRELNQTLKQQLHQLIFKGFMRAESQMATTAEYIFKAKNEPSLNECESFLNVVKEIDEKG
jgi:hypothetical protein